MKSFSDRPSAIVSDGFGDEGKIGLVSRSSCKRVESIGESLPRSRRRSKDGLTFKDDETFKRFPFVDEEIPESSQR